MDDATLDQLHAMLRTQSKNTDGSYNVLLTFLTQDIQPFPTASQAQFEAFLPQLNSTPFPCQFESTAHDDSAVCGSLTQFAVQALNEQVAAMTATLILSGAKASEAQTLLEQELSTGQNAIEFSFNLLDDPAVSGVSSITIQPYRPRTQR